MIRRFQQLALVAAGLAGVALAASAASAAQFQATGTTRLVRPLSTTSIQLAFGRLQPAPSGTATVSATLPVTRTGSGVTLLPGATFNSAVITLTGEPGLAYRLVLPTSVASSPSGYVVNRYAITSTNQPVVTNSNVRTGQLDGQGKDTIRIGATIAIPVSGKNEVYSASIPVSVSYE